MIISHKYKFIFFACGKTGTHSVEALLDKYHDADDITKRVDQELEKLRLRYSCPYTLKHVRPGFVKNLIDPEIWNTYYKFVFVRNPWDWVLSNFTFNYKYLAKTLYRFEPIHVYAVYHLLKINNQTPYAESYFQHTFVVDENGDRLVDSFGKLENFQEDYNRICSRLGIKQESLEKRNTTSHLHYKELYSEEAKKMVAELYKKDIEILGYEF